jgi:thioredoxin 1
MSGAREVTDATFGDVVLAADRPILVDFWAPWCGPCRLVSPVVDALGKELADKLLIAKVDIDDNVAVATTYSIFSIPTLVLFKDGREVDRVIGYKRKEDLAARLARHL